MSVVGGLFLGAIFWEFAAARLTNEWMDGWMRLVWLYLLGLVLVRSGLIVLVFKVCIDMPTAGDFT